MMVRFGGYDGVDGTGDIGDLKANGSDERVCDDSRDDGSTVDRVEIQSYNDVKGCMLVLDLSQKIMVGRCCTPRRRITTLGSQVICASRGLAAHRLVCMLDSLVRVSRRVGWKAHYADVSSALVPQKESASPPGRERALSFLGLPDGIGRPKGRLLSRRGSARRPAPRVERRISFAAVLHPTGTHTRLPFASLTTISSTF
ncbi:hypothetical protein R1sor_009269 [Riccia sorocarpa]|uniref:Uncharacterized protein n=1 Tax=Riccia sorocarpa TaxID=122646 RepID=A0ABD3HUM6_9MARC